MKKYLLLFLLHLSFRAFSEPIAASLFLDAKTKHLQNIRDIAISPLGNEIYFTHQDPDFKFSVIYFVYLRDDKWSAPRKASFSGKHMDMEPFFYPGGSRLYFVSDRPHSANAGKEKNFDIWYVEPASHSTTISPKKWQDPVHPDEPFNTAANEFYPSFTSTGDLYFTSDKAGTKGKDDIFYCRFENGTYAEPVSLSGSINSDGYEYNAFVAADGSFLIFTGYKRPGGYGSGDLYISYSLPDGEWSEAVNMGPGINSKTMDYCPFVDASGNLYFTSKRGILELASEKEIAKEGKKFPGGKSKLYSLSIADRLKLKN